MYVKHFGVPAPYLNGECASNSQWLVYGRTKDGTVWRTESLDGACAGAPYFGWCAGAPVLVVVHQGCAGARLTGALAHQMI